MSEIWVVRAGKGGKFTEDFESHGCAAIGYTVPHDLTGRSREEIAKLASEGNPEDSDAAVANYAGQMFRFANDIRVGDWVITPDSGTRELLYGKVEGPYEFQSAPKISSFHHTVPVVWHGRKSRDLLPQRVLYSLGSVLTVFQPKGREHLLAFVEGRDVTEVPDVLEPDEDIAGDDDLFADLESRSDELIQQKLAFLDGYETQRLFAGVLRAMGYHTQVASEGADGGVDIVASRDPLAVEPPIIKVQVKARPNSKTGPGDVRQLTGVLHEGERGVFLATGGFTKDAQAGALAGRVQLIDLDRLQELVVEYYDSLDQDTKSLIPLRRLYFP